MTAKHDKKTCFVISPIGDEDSDTRKRSDTILKYIITPPTESLGYNVVRADKISEPGIITTQIIQHIVDSDLVIADLTERNPNVFYELALRHAIRKPLVQMIRKGDLIPFDVAATRIIQFDLQDLASVEKAKIDIQSQVKSLETNNNDMDNPISVSIDLKVLKESGNAEQRSLADVVEAISELRAVLLSGEKGIVSSKFIDELKVELENLPSRITNRIDPDFKRKRRFHPGMIEELFNFSRAKEEPYLDFLIMLSFIKEDYPWLYEFGLETYRKLKSAKTKAEKLQLFERYKNVFDMTRHPMMREFSSAGKSEEAYMFNREVLHVIERFLDRTLHA
jgi:hypothetical protein